jgi:DNA-binding NarL/FixJ family response regulator
LATVFDIVGESGIAEEAIALIRRYRPDLVLIEVRLKGGTGAQVIRDVGDTRPDIKFLVLADSVSRDDFIDSIDAGVHGFLAKSASVVDLPYLVSQALSGSRLISKQVAGHLIAIDQDAGTVDLSADPVRTFEVPRLTPREGEVVALIAHGSTYQEVSRDLDVPLLELEDLLVGIMDKLEVLSRRELLDRFGEEDGQAGVREPRVPTSPLGEGSIELELPGGDEI